MGHFSRGWGVQVRVLKALMLRELTTRFGRENIGFLWIMGEPLLFAVLVSLVWRAMKGPFEFGVDIVVFVVSGYIPLVLFRSSFSRSIQAFTANSALLYHRQIKVLDLLLVRFLLELIGHMMAYLFVALALGALGIFPWPYDLSFILLGWLYYAIFTFAICTVLAPLSETNEIFEKLAPVTTYLMVPFSGGFFFVSALKEDIQHIVLYSPPVHGMEMMRYGIFGPSIDPQFSYSYPIAFSLPCMVLGLAMCRRIRRDLVVE